MTSWVQAIGTSGGKKGGVKRSTIISPKSREGEGSRAWAGASVAKGLYKYSESLNKTRKKAVAFGREKTPRHGSTATEDGGESTLASSRPPDAQKLGVKVGKRRACGGA